ncbi:MAG TPA: tetratricopeptide repeat protein [Anaerolineae bacterium]|nr:tetratricopeptide repeat protein [Anaerolineae bacterium]HOQ97679.1 tetratricopeptide repeat protein [Anaerolineae bacterium]HPL26611.1 tetratricopeptide repeat protein [Anaerolineae bacterium]
MPAQISGVVVATAEDLRRLEARIDATVRQIAKAEKDARALHEENASKIRVLQADLKAQQARADRLEAEIKGLAQVLDAIATEVERSSALLGEAGGSIAETSGLLEQLAGLVATQNEARGARHEELTDRLDHLLAQRQGETAALHGAFADLQTGVAELAQAEQDGSRQIEHSIRMLREAVVQAQSQAQEELTQMAEAAHEATRARDEQAQQEAAALERLLAAQTHLAEHLLAIQTTASNMAASSARAQGWQEERLSQAKARWAHALNGQAAALLHRGECAAAAPLLEEAMRLAPDDVTIRANLALACMGTGQSGRAEALLLEAVTADGEAVAALNELGVLYLDLGNPQAALTYLERAVQLAPEEAAIWLNLGRAHYGCGAVAQAMAAWQRAAELEPLLVASDAEVRIALSEQAILGGAA